MAYIRRLPSGRWQATVRTRNGKRHTFTDPLKGVVKKWAAEQEARSPMVTSAIPASVRSRSGPGTSG